jgi:putative ABC transport system substrate-binding protein
MKTSFLLLSAVLTAALAFFPDDARPQNAKQNRRIGVLQIGKPPASQAAVAPTPANPFTWSLANHGYVEGKNLTIERRWGDYEDLPALARELQQIKVEVIGVWGTQGARIVQKIVKSTPLVMYSCDPFEHVTKLARPAGNVTGTTCMTTELSPKRLELLRELLPRAKRVVMFGDPEDAPEGWRLTQQAAQQLGFTIQNIAYKRRAGIPQAL